MVHQEAQSQCGSKHPRAETQHQCPLPLLPLPMHWRIGDASASNITYPSWAITSQSLPVPLRSQIFLKVNATGHSFAFRACQEHKQDNIHFCCFFHADVFEVVHS